MKEDKSCKKVATFGKVIFGLGSLIGMWSLASLISGINASGGIINMLHNYAVAMGPSATMVESYTNFKGIEYLIVVAFLVVIIPFIQYLNTGDEVEVEVGMLKIRC